MQSKTYSQEPIAIIGIGCRFPGEANTPTAFWKLLSSGQDAITQVPNERWNWRAFYDTDAHKSGKIQSRHGGFINQIDQFDPQFFGISPREAAYMDPQQRLLLEVAWEALEDGGQAPERLAGSDTGVFIGIFMTDYGEIQMTPGEREAISAYTHVGKSTCIAANRISYVFDFRGPSIALDTACSSSLVAVHLACQSLWRGESSMALAGGANVLLKPETTISLSKAMMLSPDGRCFTFDERANGYVRGEGAGVILLKPLPAALRDQDPIYAVIRGTAVSQDGRTNGIMMPDGPAQERLVRAALHQANVAPEQIQYVEAHGTGTAVGDPIEARALGNVLGVNRPVNAPCLLGSVKTNIGHLEAAAGIAGLIKTVLALHYGQIPPHLHLTTPNPQIPLEQLHLRIPTTVEPWPDNNETMRLAGVNSFGFGGTGAHIVLAGHDSTPPETLSQPGFRTAAATSERQEVLLIPFSAHSQEALRTVMQNSKIFLTENQNDLCLADIGYTFALRRGHHKHRISLVTHSKEELVGQLAAYLADEPLAGFSTGTPAGGSSPQIVFVFSGMGPQWWAMGQQLLAEEPVFRQSVEECDRLLRPYTNWSLLAELTASESASRLQETAIAQPAIMALQIALAALYRSWGITPAAIIGHSVGEVAAAHIAGVLSLEEAVQVIFHRSRLQQRTAGQGRMLAVGLSQTAAEQLLLDYPPEVVVVAAVNSPNNVTLSGEEAVLAQIEQRLTTQAVFCRFLQGNVPYHSPKMTPLLYELQTALRELTPQPAIVPLFSTVTGAAINGEEMNADYWAKNVRNPVQFAPAVEEFVKVGYTLFLELNAHPVLTVPLHECLAQTNVPGVILASLRRNEPERAKLLETAGKLYTLGYPLDWRQLGLGGGRFLRLPTYPWQRQRYWNESPLARQIRQGQNTATPQLLLGNQHPLLGQQLQSPQPIWHSEPDRQTLAYLADHRLEGSVVFPGAAYLEMALAAGQTLTRTETVHLEAIRFQTMLVLNPKEPPILQFYVNNEQNHFAIYSQTKGSGESWLQHVSGRLVNEPETIAPEPMTISALRRRCPEEISPVAYYQQMRQIGLQYGPAFQGITQLFKGEKESLARIKLPASLNQGDFEMYRLHPALLDAAFQTLLVSVTGSGTGLYLPYQIDHLQLYGRSGTEFWSYARLTAQQPGQISGDISILDEYGRLLVAVEGFCCRRVEQGQEELAEKATDHLYEYRWLLSPQLLEDRLPFSTLPTETGSNNDLNYLLSPNQIAGQVRPTATQLDEKLDRQAHYHGWQVQANALSRAYIVDALIQLGWQPQVGQRLSTSMLAAELDLAEQHWPLLRRWLVLLSAEEIVQPLADDHWLIMQRPHLPRPTEKWPLMMAQFPAYLAELTLLDRCGRQLAQVLRDEVGPLQLIFPSNGMATTEHLYQHAPSSRIYNLLLQRTVGEICEQLPEGKVLRILEIGAGTGGATTYLLPVLPAGQTTYSFTDVTDLFLSQAQQKFREYPFLQFRRLDISADPQEQGFLTQSFDLVLASNVLHATPDMQATLGHINTLLAPGGLLLLQEITAPSDWFDLTFGLLKGWWAFTDFDLRPAHPLLSPDQWRAVVAESGFEETTILSDSAGAASEQSIILTRKPIIAGQPQPEMAVMEQDGFKETGSWLIFADRTGVGARIARSLDAVGETTILITPGRAPQAFDASHFQIRPEQPDDMQWLVAHALTGRPPCRGLLHLWSLDTPPLEESAADSFEGLSNLACLSTLHLIQAVDQADWPELPRLWLITQGVHALVQAAPVTVAQAPLWGLRRVIANELPGLRSTLIDLSPTVSPAEVKALLAELWSNSAEDEIALRGMARYVHRLHHSPLTKFAGAQVRAKELPVDQTYRLQAGTPGVLDSLHLAAIPRSQPGPDEVEIEVQAVGLHFLDVMIAMGMLRDQENQLISGHNVGHECAGVVTAVGTGVTDLKVGDEVIGVNAHQFARHLVLNTCLVFPKPEQLSFEAGVTAPLVFVTAYYTLHELARIRPGERLLIHSAAGGFGLAAIQIARNAGAEIFATAGSPEKRAFLRALGVPHVFDSRSAAFADAVRDRTGGEGVDIVLNSMTGEMLEKSLALLRPFGRFIELGKQDIQRDYPLGLQRLRRNISFMVFDLLSMRTERPEQVRSILQKIMPQLASGELQPLPHRVFPVSEVRQAFYQMAQARHIGKVVISLADAEGAVVQKAQEALPISAAATYLITGGLGGFGLATAQWLVANGARHLVLMGRSKASPEAQIVVEQMETAGAEVAVMQADVTQTDQVAAVLEYITRTMPPLKGIIHAALVLDDGVLLQLNAKRLQKVMAPKVTGAWHLHTQTLDIPLDFFVLYSSSNSLVGNPGQGNYAAACAFLDTLALHRQSQGLPGLTINWGVIGDVGYVAHNPAIGKHLARQGVNPLMAREMLAALGKSLQHDIRQAGIMYVDWPHWLQLHPTGVLPRFASLPQTVLAPASTTPPESQGEGEEAPIGNRLRDQVAKVLFSSPDKLDLQEPLVNLGLDSLMAVELVARLKQKFDLDLSTMQLLGGLTIADLINLLLKTPARNQAALATQILLTQSATPDLEKEAALDPTIMPDARTIDFVSSPTAILLTGATGFLGAFLLVELLQHTEATIFCLVLAGNAASGQQRIHQNLTDYGLGQMYDHTRIVPIVGDLAQPRLGLADDQYRQLADEIEHIYHCAAVVNFIYPYQRLKTVNVSGTQEVLRLAGQGRIKTVHCVTTLPAVFQPTADPLREIGALNRLSQANLYDDIYLQKKLFDIGYVQSKWVMDRLVMAARDRGLPVILYRPNAISGHSQSGHWNTNDYICRLIKGCILLGYAPEQDIIINLSPVDYVSRAIRYLSLQEASLGRGFNLANPRPINWNDLVEWLSAQGYPLQRLPAGRWRDLILEKVQSPDQPLYPLRPLFARRPVDRLLLGYPTHMRTPQLLAEITTHKALADSNIECPPVDEQLLSRYLAYFIQSGFISAVRGKEVVPLA